MVVCPIALVAGCARCPAVSICPLKGVLGDHKPDAPADKPAAPAAGKPPAGKR